MTKTIEFDEGEFLTVLEPGDPWPDFTDAQLAEFRRLHLERYPRPATIAPCPDCGSVDIYSTHYDMHRVGRPDWYTVQCDCKRRVRGDTLAGAWEAWNNGDTI